MVNGHWSTVECTIVFQCLKTDFVQLPRVSLKSKDCNNLVFSLKHNIESVPDVRPFQKINKNAPHRFDREFLTKLKYMILKIEEKFGCKHSDERHE